MDNLWVGLGQMLGTFALVYFGGKKAAHRLETIVEDVLTRVERIEKRLGIPHVPRPKNGKTADLNVADIEPRRQADRDELAERDRKDRHGN